MARFWTEEKIQKLKTLWDNGGTGAEIAAVLGTTRNAVLGKVNRIGLSRNDGWPCKITVSGITKDIDGWSTLTGIPARTIRNRISRGWDRALAVTKPVRPIQRKEAA